MIVNPGVGGADGGFAGGGVCVGAVIANPSRLRNDNAEQEAGMGRCQCKQQR